MKTVSPARFRLTKTHALALLAPLIVSCAGSIRTATIISPGDLARGNYVINAPGNYRLGGDVVVSGIAAGTPVIKITADNVSLDLNRHVISMPSSGSSTGNTGIEINGVSNIVVTNGSLNELSGAAIYLVCDVDPAARKCSNFTFSQLDIRNVGKRGEYLDLGNIFNRPFAGGIIVFGRSTPVPAAGGSWENSINGVLVSNVTVRNDKSIKHLFPGAVPAGGQNGVTFASVSNLRVEDSAVSGMTSNDAGACIFLGRTKSVVVRRLDCKDATGDRNANGLDSMTNTTSPPAIKKNYDVLVEDSTFSNITATGPRANEALGIELNGEKFTFNNLVVSDVKNDNTNAEGNRAIGFQITNNEASDELSRVSNCTVRNVSNYGASRDSRAGGMSIEGAPPVLVSRCSVSNIVNHSTGSSIKAFGFRVDPATKKKVFEQNSVDGVSAPAVTRSAKPIPGYVAGFALVNARADMSQNRVRNAHVGLFVNNLATDAGISGNQFECNGTGVVDSGPGKVYSRNRLTGNAAATVPAALLGGTDNIVTAARGNGCEGR
jgi:hypothetical protein